jgi:hypothetical protein
VQKVYLRLTKLVHEIANNFFQSQNQSRWDYTHHRKVW